MIRKGLLWTSLMALPLCAQDESSLRRYFEGKRIAVKMDMPATKNGVDVYWQREPAIDYKEYSRRIKGHGTSLRTGDEVAITTVKVKDKLIEFQLGGGGFGTLGDDSSTYVSPSYTSKSNREKDLEQRVKWEPDPAYRSDLERELSDLRSRRERVDAQSRIAAEQASEAKKERVMQQALQAGSRFNIRFPEGYLAQNPPTPEMVVRALSEYVDFGPIEGAALMTAPAGSSSRFAAEPAAPAPAPGGGLRRGMSEADAQQLYGRPSRVQERTEGNLKVKTLTFSTAEAQVEADFVEGLLIRYRMNSR